MNYDAEFCRQIRISEDEKRECLALISEILYLATSARNYGLLSLGKEAEEHSSFLMRKGLQLALDGVKSNTARTILELCILTADYTGKDLLERCIILEGIIGILEGMHPKLLRELLLAFLGESGYAIFESEYEPLEKERLTTYLKKVEKQPAASKSAAELGELIEPLHKTVIKRFLQVINTEELAKVMVELDGGVQIKLFDNLPERGTFLLLDAIEQLNSVSPPELQEAQDKVVAIISDLKDQELAQ
jgi:hypothetical protein